MLITFAGKQKVMTISDFYDKRLDLVLDMFYNTVGGAIERRVLFDKAPQDFDRALSFLVAEGLLEEDEYGFKITYKGKALHDNGGFSKKNRRERALFYCAVVATGCAVASLAVSLVALLR